MKKITASSSAAAPLFEGELREKYMANISHTFVFHGATYDLVAGYKTLKERLHMLVTQNSRAPKGVIIFDRASGISFFGSSDKERFMQALGADFDASFGGGLPSDPASAFRLIDLALRRDDFALIVDYADTVFPAGEMAQLDPGDRAALVHLLKWAKDVREIRDRGNMIFLITSTVSKINCAITEPASRIEAIGIPYPNPEERNEFIETTIQKLSADSRPVAFAPAFSTDAMARTTAGLAKVHIYDIFQRARLQGVPVSQNLVRVRKNEIISQEFQNILQIVEPASGFDMMGGYDYLKTFFKRNVIDAVTSGNTRRCPMGVLLMGPAGTGKSAFAEALAFECGFNYVNFNVARTKEKWVGSSEANMEKAIWAIKSLTPLIVFIDELDTAVSRENAGDSGVSQNIMKRLLEVMSDTSNRGKIIWLAATNKPENIDFALKRTGRLDKKIPVLPPTTGDLPHIYEAMLRKHKISHSLTFADLAAMEAETDHWDKDKVAYVGSDIEAITLKAYEIAEDAGSDKVSLEHIKEAKQCIVPSVQDVSSMVASALRECNDLSLIPEGYRKRPERGAVAAGEFAREL